jgi:hypothetical protein
MRRKLWIISLIVALTLGTLTACGDGEEDEDDDDGRARSPQVAVIHGSPTF